MMIVDLTYHKEKISVNFPDDVKVDIFEPSKVSQPFGYDDFKHQFEQLNLSEFFSNKKILCVVNDAHRSTPTEQIFNWINQLDEALIEKIDFLVACGTHDLPDENELKKIFGKFFFLVQPRVKFHNCHDLTSMKFVGKDRFDQEVYLNHLLFEYGNILIINSVEPHYFAGYTGGRKSLCPGLADFKTIERNHNLASSLDCAPMKLKNNPMAEHLENIISLFNHDHILTLQVVYDRHKNIDSLHWGNINDAFASAIERADKLYHQTTEHYYDLALLEIASPLDKSIYQAQKALENNQSIVVDKGAVVIVSPCYEGVGSKHFYELADNWDAEKNCAKDGQHYFGSHKLYRVIEIGKRIFPGIFCQADKDDVNKLFYKPVEHLQKFIDLLYAGDKLNRAAVVYDAAHLVITNDNK